ncbi:extracellular solute-binding protein [Enterococcus timonensis]|uniref:extracellular solute-binding protein n=1 Tax=Enterococcus timonensis TaxID=1852364 RepID=UPI0008DA7DD2|nr:extracellular solute-binding protein [Enterococcus timonensis]
MKKGKKISLVAGLLVAGVVLAACGGDSKAASDKGGSESSGDNKTEEKSDKTSVSWMTMLHTPTPPSGDVEKQLEDYTGMDIEFNWIPAASTDERINAALASQTLADIVSLTQISSTTVRSALASGMFWDVEPYLKDYPNLKNISADRLESSRIDGKVYGVPFQKPIARYGVLVRQDWLDNLSLDVPHTYDDLKKVAQAFSEDDPDGNGTDDTVGFVDRQESYSVGFKAIAVNFGAGNLFAVEDGKVIPSFMQDEYKEAMEWYREIYENGWMNSDFTVMAKADQKDYIVQGKGGIVLSGLFDGRNYKSAAKGTAQEDQEWVLINDITAGDVERRTVSDTNGGMGGWLAIPKQNIESEADLKVVLQFINDLMDEEPFNLMTNGIEGKHYEITADGAYERTDDTAWQQEVQPFAGSRPSELVETYKTTDELQNESNELIADNEAYAVINPAQPLSSETYDTQWSTLVEGIEDAYYKYMMGEIDMDGFDAAVENWQKAGGDQIIKEFTESYEKNK